MEIILLVIVFVAINVFFLRLINKHIENQNYYDTINCRDVRAELGMFAYPLAVEAKRKRLNNKKSKF